MKVLINTSTLANQHAGRGIGRYTQELLTALRKISPHDIFYSSIEDKPTQVDLIHYPFFDIFFWTLPIIKKKPTVITVHDVTPLVFAKHYPPGVRGRVKFFFQKLAVRNVRQIITDSAVSKRDIVEKLKISAEKITVVPLAASEGLKRPPQAIIDTVRKKYELPKYFALYVGDINYNKNIPFLISAMRAVPKLTLVLVGRNMLNTEIPEGKAIQTAIVSSGMQKRVRMITTMNSDSLEELAALYSGASVYVQPSLYEGFGLPVLEAMQCKTPVACSLGGSLPEVAGENAFYFHPHDEDECAQAIMKALRLTSRSRLHHVQKAFEWTSQFTWERTARETLAVYKKIVS